MSRVGGVWESVGSLGRACRHRFPRHLGPTGPSSALFNCRLTRPCSSYMVPCLCLLLHRSSANLPHPRDFSTVVFTSTRLSTTAEGSGGLQHEWSRGLLDVNFDAGNRGQINGQGRRDAGNNGQAKRKNRRRNVVSRWSLSAWNALWPGIESRGSWFARHICHGALIYMECRRRVDPIFSRR